MRSSVRTRITLVATAVVAVALVLASWTALRLVERDLLNATQRALDAELQLNSQILDSEGFFVFDFEVQGRPLSLGMFTVANEGLAFGELFEQGAFIGEVVIDLDETEVLEVRDPLTGESIPDPFLIRELQAAALDVQEIEGDFFDGDFVDGESVIVGAAARDEVDESLAAVRNALVFIVPALVAAMGLLIWLLVGRALRPVGAMSQQVDAISTTSLDQRVPVPAGRDEVSHLAAVMNRMLDRLQRGDRRQREFAADASHELRSPLSTVRAAAEMIEHHAETERTGTLAGDIMAEADRMDVLIGDLLQLSRIDDERAATKFVAVDLGQLAADAAAGATVTAEPGLMVSGSEEQLRRLIQNLVSNGHRHAHSQVHVHVRPGTGDLVELRVDDDGAGIQVEDRERVFERFSRLDQARSRDGGGSGLGLALVRAITQRHGGSVRVDTAPTLGGASFVVRLPRTGSPGQEHREAR